MADLAELIARAFHVEYERLAPQHGYETRKESRTDWAHVPANNRALMTATAQALLDTGVIAPGPLYAAGDVLEDAEREGHYACVCGWEGPAGEADGHATTCVGAGEEAA